MKEQFALLKEHDVVQNIYGEQFNHFYQENGEDLKKIEDEYEKLKKKYERKKFKGTIFIIIGVTLFMPLFGLSDSNASNATFIELIGIIGLIFLIAGGIMFIKPNHKVFDEDIINKIIKEKDKSSSFQLEGIKEEEFKEPNIYTDFNKYDSTFTFMGSNKKYEYSFSKISTQKIVYTGKTTVVISIFEGLFYKIKLIDFRNEADIKVIEDGLFEIFKKKRKGLPRVKLEDIDFEKKYDVYSNDQIASRAILKPNVMENLNDFSKEAKSKVRLALIQDCIYIQVAINYGIFKSNFKDTSSNFKQEVLEYYTEYQAARDFIDDVLDVFEIKEER